MAIGTLGITTKFNFTQINGVAVVTGNGVVGTGVQRVAIASDNTPFSVKLDQTTPGTTNAASLSHIGATAVATGNGVVSAGVQRVAIASDNTPFGVLGNVAHGAADSGNPLKVGGKARITNPAAVTDAQRVDASFDDLGRQIVVVGQSRDLIGRQTTTITNSTAETTIVTAIASTFCDIAQLVITNASATAFTATLKDSTAGTTVGIFDIAANGGIVITFARPLNQTTVNNNWTITLSVNTVTVHILAVFDKNV